MSVEAAGQKPTTIKLNATQKELYVGQKYTLKVKTVKPAKASKAVTWKSSNKKVATVNSKGKVTAKKAGTAKITATSKANKKVKAVCKITVCNKATKITLNRTEKDMSVGEEFVLKVKTVKPAKASKEVTWKSSDKKVATVSSAGKVVAKKAGTVKITATSKSNSKVKATCVVYVEKEEEPTAIPTVTQTPDEKPTATPTEEPSATPKPVATAKPTTKPTTQPNVTDKPTATPTEEPEETLLPTRAVTPTAAPQVTIAESNESITIHYLGEQKNVNMFMSESLVDYKICRVNDIAANTMWMWQGAIGVSKYHGVISPSYNVYRQTSDEFDPDYLDYLLRIRPLVDAYNAYSTGITASRLRLYPEQFLSFFFFVPSREEQREIVEHLDRMCHEMDTLIAKKTALLTELETYKKSLIYEYVTGKKEV